MEKKNNLTKSVLVIFILIVILYCLCLMLTVNFSSDNISMYLFLIIYLVLTGCFLVKERNNIVNIKTIFVTIFTFMVGLSPFAYYLNNKTVISNTGQILNYQFYMILLGYICMLVGFNFGKYRKEKLEETAEDKEIYTKYFAYLLISISMICNVYYIISNRTLFLGGNLEDGRIQALSSNGLILLLTSLHLPGIGLLYNYCLKNQKSKNIVWILVIINSIFYIIRGSRSSIINIILLIVLIRNFYKPVALKNMINLCILFLIGLAVLQVFRTNMSRESTNIVKEFYSILQSGSVNINYIYEEFPESTPFQFGNTFLINLKMLLPGPDMDFTLWLKDTIGISFSGGGITPTIIGEAYLNFGYFGIILFMFLIGVIGNYLNSRYYVDKQNVVWIVYVTVIMIGAFRGGIANVEINLLTSIFLIIAYKVLYKIIRKYEKPKNDLESTKY